MFSGISDLLGDPYQDCLNTVAGTPADHVYRGQTVTVSGSMGAGIYLQPGFEAQVQTALNSAGFSAVSVSAPGFLGGGNWSVSVTANTDYNSINDVQSVVAGAVSAAGGPTGPMTAVKNNISPSDICAVWKGGPIPGPVGPGPGPGPDTPTPPGAKPDWLKQLEDALGGTGGSTLLIAGIVLVALLSRR